MAAAIVQTPLSDDGSQTCGFSEFFFEIGLQIMPFNNFQHDKCLESNSWKNLWSGEIYGQNSGRIPSFKFNQLSMAGEVNGLFQGWRWTSAGYRTNFCLESTMYVHGFKKLKHLKKSSVHFSGFVKIAEIELCYSFLVF